MLNGRGTRALAAVYIAICTAGSIAGFFLGVGEGIIVLCIELLLSAVFFLYTKARYKRIAHMTEQLDMVLHNTEHLYIGDCDEGELSVLQSEIAKMTARIREQNDTLKREKEYLAESLADVAHQLRTPLTSVNMVLSFLEGCKDDEQRRRLLREALSLLARMDMLLTSLLKLSRLDAGVIAFHKESVSVRELIDCALQPLRIPLDMHNISITTDIPDGAAVEGDRIWLAEAIQNILKNCMEQAGDEGCIDISCSDTLIYTGLFIHDTGEGFKSEDIPHLFERFYRGKNSSAAGFGIGLALSKTIIARHSGIITAENHPEGGALFKIKLYK